MPSASKDKILLLDDILFEFRNKEYGAYLLRRLYHDHILKALFIAITAFTFFVFGPLLLEKLWPESTEIETPVELTDPKMIEPPPIDPKTPPPPKLPSLPPPPKISTIRFVPPVVVPDEEVLEKDPPKQEELKTVQIASETVKGDPLSDPNELRLDDNGTGDVIGAPPPVEEEFLMVDQMPEFPEGDIQVYFSKHLKYPQKAVKAEVSGRVHLSFLVLPDGSIGDVKINKGLGFGLDEEAMRVVSTMPKWRPGKQGGRAVKVRINLPIKFSL